MEAEEGFMTKADQIRQMDDAQLADLLCSLAETKCESCKFGNAPASDHDECAAMVYLHQEVEE